MATTDQQQVIPLRDPMVHDLHARVTKLEDYALAQRDRESNRSTELAVMKNDMTYVKESVGGIQKGINRILWAIGLSVLGAIVTFILSGGLIVIQQ